MFRRLLMEAVRKLSSRSAKRNETESIERDIYSTFALQNKQMQTAEKTEAALFAIQNPPKCIADFMVSTVWREGDINICARFSLTCKTCGSTEFRIWCHPEINEGYDKDSDDPDEKILEQDPHLVECLTCGKKHTVFDSSKNGYDGELGHNGVRDTEIVEAVPIKCPEQSYGVDVIFTYNNEFDENKETAGEYNLLAQNLFDWFHIVAIKNDGTVLKEIDCECA